MNLKLVLILKIYCNLTFQDVFVYYVEVITFIERKNVYFLWLITSSSLSIVQFSTFHYCSQLLSFFATSTSFSKKYENSMHFSLRHVVSNLHLNQVFRNEKIFYCLFSVYTHIHWFPIGVPRGGTITTCTIHCDLFNNLGHRGVHGVLGEGNWHHFAHEGRFIPCKLAFLTWALPTKYI